MSHPFGNTSNVRPIHATFSRGVSSIAVLNLLRRIGNGELVPALAAVLGISQSILKPFTASDTQQLLKFWALFVAGRWAFCGMS